jgi:RNA polymerase sigma-70 factor (ECF subfamily)
MADFGQLDSQLATRARDGDDAAFAVLLQRYRQPILNFVYRLLGDATEAEDVAQDVFVSAYRHLADYDPRRQFSTWLFTLARNAAIDRLRYRQRHPTEPMSDIVAASPARGPSDEVAVNDLGRHIAAAIQSLPEDQRTAIVLAEYHDLSQAEIAKIMDCSVKSVESRLYRAKQILRGRLVHLLE